MTRSRKLLFVVGIGRSGTSLIQAMLASHSRISFPPETSFFRRYVVTGKLTKAFKKSGKNILCEILKADTRIARTNLVIDRIVDRATAGDPSQIDLSIYIQILSANSPQYRNAILGDKDPRLIEQLKAIYDYWPDAKIVHIFRDPRDVLASKKNAAWSHGQHALRHILAGNVQWRCACKHGNRLFGENYRLLQYEKLLAAPDDELRALCKWLGVSYEDRMMSFGAAGKQLVADDELQWKMETLGPLLKDNVGKWKRDLSQFEALLVERANRDIFSAGNYQLTESDKVLGYLDFLALKLLSVLINVAAHTYVGVRR